MTALDDFEKEKFMRRALELAKKGWGKTDPNPMVGAVIVENGAIVAEGFHEKTGGDHAETAAIKKLGRPPAEGAILFVTLEPCSTEGRTGACTGAIVKAGIRQVVAGATDANPERGARRFATVREEDVTAEARVLETERTDLNQVFTHGISEKQTCAAAKSATTLDGKSACRTGDSKWITSEVSRQDVMW